MEFRVLGPLEVCSDDGTEVRIGSQRQRSVLAVLLLAGGRTVSADAIIEAVWGDALPANPTNALQNAIAHLRKALEPYRKRSEAPTVLVSNDAGYRIALESHSLDVAELEDDLSEATQRQAGGELERARDLLDGAAARWRGTPYADFVDQPFADRERDRLDAIRHDSEERRAQVRLDQGEHAALVATLEAMVDAEPYRELRWEMLITALYRAGRQADALDAYQRAATLLVEELGIDPSPALQELERRVLVQDLSLRAPTPRGSTSPNNLPAAVDQLIGRAGELDTLVELLGQQRLVTLLGPGGSGKTRLAIEAARRLTDDAEGPGRHGVWLIRLDELRDPTLVGAAIASALSVPEDLGQDLDERLIGHLRERHVLLVLDNCEHVVNATAALSSELLDRCPGLTILGTSQVSMELAAEQRVPLFPLSTDGIQSAAVELFVERSRRQNLQFAPDAADLESISRIVAAVDGLPLSIELAAARVGALSLDDIEILLADRFRLLAHGPRDLPERQRSLAATIEWSYGLLDPSAQVFLADVSVFRSGFDLAAAASVTNRDTLETADLAQQLHAASLLHRTDQGGPVRYRMLESVRLFAADLARTAANDQTAWHPLAKRHASHYRRQAQLLDQQLLGPSQLEALHRFTAERDNLRAAIDWGLETGEPDAVALAAGIAGDTGRYWDWVGSLREAHRYLERAGSAAESLPSHLQVPRVGVFRAFFAAELGDRERAVELIEHAHATSAEHRAEVRAELTASLAITSRLSGDFEAGLALLDEARQLAIEAGHVWLLAYVDNLASLLHLDAGNVVEARQAALVSRDRFEALNDARAVGWAVTALAQCLLEADDASAALAESEAAIRISSAVSDGRNAAWAAEVAALAAQRLGQSAAAIKLRRRASRLLEERGLPTAPWSVER